MKGKSPFANVPILKTSFPHVIDYHWSNTYSGIDTETDFDALYPHRVLVLSIHPFAKKLLALPSSKRKLIELGYINENEDLEKKSWYRMCALNLFQPSDYLMNYLKPYLDRFKDHFVIGMHARMGEGLGKWHEKTTFIKLGSVRYQIPIIQKMLSQHRKTLFFLSTDSDKVESMMKKQFGHSLVIVDSLPRMHVGRNDADEMGVIRSFMDMYLLGQCDYMYVTRGSGFSRMGVAFSSKRHTVVSL